MKITNETVERIAKLSRLALSDEERATLSPQFEEIVAFVEKINELDTKDVPPTYHVVPVKNVVREDVARKGLTPEEIAELAPKSENDHIVVPAVIE